MKKLTIHDIIIEWLRLRMQTTGATRLASRDIETRLAGYAHERYGRNHTGRTYVRRWLELLRSGKLEKLGWTVSSITVSRGAKIWTIQSDTSN